MRDSKRDADVQNRLTDSVGEGEGGMIWANGIETYIISYKKQIAILGSMHDTGCLGHPSAPAPSILYHASNLDWRFVSYMILYMFQCHSPKSSHPLPLPESPKDCSIHLCLFAVSHTGLLFIGFSVYTLY